MKHNNLLLVFPMALLTFSGLTHSASPAGCEAKKLEIENKIAYAREHNNSHHIDGLQKALHETESQCTEQQLLEQRNRKMEEKNQKVAECQAELEQARETGNPKKMAQKQKKLDRAREELQDAQNRLDQ